MDWDLGQLFSTPPITGVTINTVMLAPEFRTALYVLIGLVIIVGTAIFLLNKSSFSIAVKKAVVLAFFASGLLYAAQADSGWADWLAADARSYGGLDSDAKLLKMEDGIYAFSQAARKIIPGDYMLFSSDGYVALREEYFLLPLRKREEAPYIVVLADNDARYDQAKRILTIGASTYKNVDPVFIFAQNAYILKRNP